MKRLLTMATLFLFCVANSFALLNGLGKRDNNY